MSKNLFSENLGDLYDMQQMVQEQMKQGMHLVVFDIDAENITKNDVYFFKSFSDMADKAIEKGIPNAGQLVHMEDFEKILTHETTIAEQKLEKPLEHLIQEINHGLQMSPASEEKYYSKVFDQDIQEQMGHDLGKTWAYLQEQKEQGKEWMAYPDIDKVSQADIKVFNNREEARDYALENSNVAVIYDYHSIDRINVALQPLVEAAINKSFDRDDNEPGKDKDKNKDRDDEMER